VLFTADESELLQEIAKKAKQANKTNFIMRDIVSLLYSAMEKSKSTPLIIAEDGQSSMPRTRHYSRFTYRPFDKASIKSSSDHTSTPNSRAFFALLD
jgi:hypothetical protein